MQVLSLVPDTSTHHQAAQIAAVRAQLSAPDPATLSVRELTDASTRIQRLRLDVATLHALTAEVLQAGLAMLEAGAAATGDERLLDNELSDAGLRLGLERSYRACPACAHRGRALRPRGPCEQNTTADFGLTACA